MSKPVNSMKIVLKNTEDVANLLMEELKNEKREIAKLLVLDSKNVLLRIINIAQGRRKLCCNRAKNNLKRARANGSTKNNTCT